MSAPARKSVIQMVAEAKSRISELSVEELQAEIAAGTCTVVDIRDFRERLEKGSIPGAISAPRGMLEFWFDPESPYYRSSYTFDDRYVFYCAGGQRSALATDVISQIGYTNVAHLEVGFNGWAEAGGEVVDVTAESKWVKRA
jgi:rhodanese-related sulfurtransferase